MAAKKAPQDRKRKGQALAAAATGRPFTFTHEGKTYTLPPASQYAYKVSAGALMDALDGGDDYAEVRLGLATLKAAQVDKPTMDALRAMPLEDFAPLLADWLSDTGVSQGEASSSSTS